MNLAIIAAASDTLDSAFGVRLFRGAEAEIG